MYRIFKTSELSSVVSKFVVRMGVNSGTREIFLECYLLKNTHKIYCRPRPYINVVLILLIKITKCMLVLLNTS